tara:strand:- start:1789 stop:2106 length:318 start_codon:yes stop_codon:yes gene_type:complete
MVSSLFAPLLLLLSLPLLLPKIFSLADSINPRRGVSYSDVVVGEDLIVITSKYSTPNCAPKTRRTIENEKQKRNDLLMHNLSVSRVGLVVFTIGAGRRTIFESSS